MFDHLVIDFWCIISTQNGVRKWPRKRKTKMGFVMHFLIYASRKPILNRRLRARDVSRKSPTFEKPVVAKNGKRAK